MPCSDCKYYRLDPNEPDRGICVRNPPVYHLHQAKKPQCQAHYIHVDGTQEPCGEYRPGGGP